MRKRDESKKEAIFQATKGLLNEIGFAEISMSKIAKRAGVSAATIYVYFDHKDDMLKKLYLDVKKKMVGEMASMMDESLSVRELIEQAMRGYLHFITDNREDHLFLEQFANSPMLENLCVEEALPVFNSFHIMIQKAQEAGILKKIDEDVIIAYCHLPLSQIMKERTHITEEEFKTILEMSWDAIKA